MPTGSTLKLPELEDFFAQACAPLPGPIAAPRVAVIVAHPDDETIGCGAILSRLHDPQVIVVTDGAPRDLVDARAYGFATAHAYAEARSAELVMALGLAGVNRDAIVQFGVPDQEAAQAIAGTAQRLARILIANGISIILTHAYEGGHPDHDATAVAAHCAAALARRHGHPVAIVEMPFYRAGENGELKQSFAAGVGETPIRLDAAQTALKENMVRCYRTQARTLAGFALNIERFRPAPVYDFRELPNGGRLLYEAHNWRMSASRWRGLVEEASERIWKGEIQWPSLS
jgi:LmbE family N-acetylglucosaminyl deacetylase